VSAISSILSGVVALATGNVPGALGDVGTLLGSGVSALIGSPGGTPTDQSRQARINAYLVGALNGNVTSARYLLQVQGSNEPKEVESWTAQAIAKIQTQAPNVWTAALAAGPLNEFLPAYDYNGSSGADGYNGLLLLYSMGIGFNQAYMGTADDGKFHSSQAQQLVPKLQALAAAGHVGTVSAAPLPAPGVTPTQTAVASAIGTAGAGVVQAAAAAVGGPTAPKVFSLSQQTLELVAVVVVLVLVFVFLGSAASRRR